MLSEAAPAGDPGLEQAVLSQLVLYFSQRLAAYRQPLWKDIEVSMHAWVGGWVAHACMQQLLAYVPRSALCARMQPHHRTHTFVASSCLGPLARSKAAHAWLRPAHVHAGHRRPGRVAAR